jgi:nicotine blue oxidoreductase
VLAAGEGRRFGGPKQLALLDGRPLIEHALAALSGLDHVVVVLGARAEEIRARRTSGAPRSWSARDWADGMSASLRHGLSALAGAEEVVITLADQPFITQPSSRACGAVPGPAARGVYDGAPGIPSSSRRPLLARPPSCTATPLPRPAGRAARSSARTSRIRLTSTRE